MSEDPLQRRVAETGLVDQRGRLRQEQVGAQAIEDQAFLLSLRRLRRLMSLVDEREQPVEGVVQVCAIDSTRTRQLDQR